MTSSISRYISNKNPIIQATDTGFFGLFKVQDNNDRLGYWLSNTSTLLLLLQHTLKASGAASLTPQRRRTASASLFGRMSQVCSSLLSFSYLHEYENVLSYFRYFLYPLFLHASTN